MTEIDIPPTVIGLVLLVVALVILAMNDRPGP